MKSVLITGGSGTFGQAFVRHCLQEDIERIRVYSRGEHRQAEMRASLTPAERERVGFFIGDVRDRDRLLTAMQGCDTIVHAAALKRIEVGEYNPGEMVKTNVHGASNVAWAAAYAGSVERVIGLSTDKAWQPVSPYGLSKALAEAMLLAGNTLYGTSGARFCIVRYGNIAGSTGSVIPTWRALLRRDPMAPVTLTDRACTRFWMTIAEAVQLVFAQACKPEMSETRVIPDWLPAYRLGDLSEAMGVRNELVVGLPAHEKLHEGMNEHLTSDKARRMTVPELREALKNV